MKRQIILSAILLLFSVMVFSQPKKSDISVTAKDRIEIIKIVLSKFDFVNRCLGKNEKKEQVYLSNKEISVRKLPKISGITFILLTPKEIQERVKTGFGYFDFQPFQVENSTVLVSLSSNYEYSEFRRRNPMTSGSPDFVRGIRYEFQKIKGKWQGKEVNGFMRGS